MNLYAPISVYQGARDNRGRQLPLADFMRLGSEQFSGQIIAIRSMKQSISEMKDNLKGWTDRIAELTASIESSANPLGGEDTPDVEHSRLLLADAQREASDLEADIKRLSDQCAATKRDLPCATISGLFSPTRAKANLQQHSGFITVDIDDHVVVTVDGEKRTFSQDLSRLPEILPELPWVLYCGHSVGGSGYFAIIPLAQMPLPGMTIDESQEWYYRCLDDEFSQYGITIDPSCKDVSRNRFCSMDQHPYRNANAIPYAGSSDFVSKAERRRREKEHAEQVLAQLRRQQASSSDPDLDYRHAISCAHSLVSRHIDITPDYDSWFKIACSLAAGLGERGRDIFHIVSSVNPKYNRSDSDKKFTSAQKKVGTVADASASLGSFFLACKDVGVSYYDRR